MATLLSVELTKTVLTRKLLLGMPDVLSNLLIVASFKRRTYLLVPGGDSLIWPIRGRAAGQGMVFGLYALNRVYNFMRTCPRQGLNLS